MANTDRPRGFYAPRTDSGGPLVTNSYVGGTTKCYIGDALKMASGKILPITDADTDIIGICAEYHDGTDDATVLVWDDLNGTTWEVQAEESSYTAGTMTQADVGTEVDISVTTGDTDRLTSKHEIMSSTDDAQVRIVDTLTNNVDNDISLVNCKVRVKFVKFAHAAAAG